MTDDTGTDPGSAETVPAETETVPVAAETAAVEHVAAEPVPFWQRPNVDRYVSPLIIPIVVVIGILVYVLNVSRVFLSAHGHSSVVVGSFLTLVILVGATMLANASNLRSSTIVLFTAGFLLVVFSSGWLVLGHSQEKNATNAALGSIGNYKGTFTITAGPGGALAFAPSSISVKTGIYLVKLVDAVDTTHTLNFDESSTLWGSGLVVNKAGEQLQSLIFFGAAGDYTYYCAVPTHRQNGMFGVVHVSGPTVTLAQAQAAAKLTAK
jgi:plastocyanin